jgi:hypothetical protein
MSLAGFEPAILAKEQSQIHVLDRAATEIGLHFSAPLLNSYMLPVQFNTIL